MQEKNLESRVGWKPDDGAAFRGPALRARPPRLISSPIENTQVIPLRGMALPNHPLFGFSPLLNRRAVYGEWTLQGMV